MCLQQIRTGTVGRSGWAPSGGFLSAPNRVHATARPPDPLAGNYRPLVVAAGPGHRRCCLRAFDSAEVFSLDIRPCEPLQTVAPLSTGTGSLQGPACRCQLATSSRVEPLALADSRHADKADLVSQLAARGGRGGDRCSGIASLAQYKHACLRCFPVGSQHKRFVQATVRRWLRPELSQQQQPLCSMR